MKTIAFVTYKKQPTLNKSDSILAQELERNQYAVEAIPWDKKTNWNRFDSVVVRSCWDYHTRYREFLSWLKMLQQVNVRVWNPIDAMRWNSHKSYLLDLEKKGIPIPATKLIQKNQSVQLSSVSPWETTIIKPAVGASAVNVMKIERSKINTYEKHFQKLLRDGDVIIQEYMKQIESAGEMSLIFFGGSYSHTVLKRVKSGGFLAHPHFGGTDELFQPDEYVIRQAKRILSLSGHKTLYARVDGIVLDGVFILMELELIEPLLFINFAPESARLFTKKILELAIGTK